MDGEAPHSTPDTDQELTPTVRLVLQREPAREDLQVDVRRARDHFIVTLAGRLSETFKGEELGRRLVGKVVFDTSGIDRVTSFGVRAWLSMLDAMDADSITFARCSEAILAQMGMIRSFVGEGRIAGFFAPYVCDDCGNAFRVHYDALHDAETIARAVAVDVPCPRCASLSTLDDEPGAFFKMGPLLTDPPEELRVALGRLAPMGLDADAIEKVIRGDTTVVRFNTRLDDSLRLGRIFDGLEGRVELDLGRVPEVTERGVRAFVRAMDGLEAEVRRVQLVGCPQEVAEGVLAAKLPARRVQVRSVSIPATCADPPLTRTIFVDVLEHASLLAVGEAPPLRCDWCDDELSIDDALPLLQKLAVRLAPPPPPAPVASSAPRPASRAALAFWAGGTFLTASSVLLGLVGMIVLAALWLTLPGPDEEGWVAGRTPPPPWTENIWTQTDADVLVVAGADGPDVDAALAAAREKAVAEIIRRLHVELADDPVRSPIGTDIDPDAIDRFLTDISPYGIPVRDTFAVRSGGRDTRLFARYRLAAADWDQIVGHYRARVPFRGIELGQRFPTESAATPGVPVVQTASWLSSPRAGQLLVAVDGHAVASLDDARRQLDAAWADVPAGSALPLTFQSDDGSPFIVDFQKKATE